VTRGQLGGALGPAGGDHDLGGGLSGPQHAGNQRLAHLARAQHGEPPAPVPAFSDTTAPTPLPVTPLSPTPLP